MSDFANNLRVMLSPTHIGLWSTIAGVALFAWLCIRSFLDDSRLRRMLSVAIPLVPLVVLGIAIGLDWPNTRRSFSFARPGYLWCLGLLPLLVWFSLKSLSGLGAVRQTLAILFRALVMALLIGALAEAQFVRYTEKMTVLFALDYSKSIPQDREAWMRDYVQNLTKKYKQKDDMAGVIFFAKTPRIEIPPLRHLELRNPEGDYDRDHSDLGAALKLAQGAFPEDTMKRIFVISDGNENRGDALRQAVTAKSSGVSIDVLPIKYVYDDEVMVEKVTIPPEIHQGETVNLNVVVRSSAPIAGTLQLFMKSDNRTTELAKTDVKLKRGVNAFSIPQKMDEPNYYEFEAHFVPHDLGQDRIATNNVAATFTYIRGTARVMLIEGMPGEHSGLVEALRQENIEVVLRGPETIPDSLAELKPFDAVILANLAKENLSDRQMEMIVANTHELGAGLIMIGGPESFGAGGYIDTPIEKALPVDMQIKNIQVTGKGALVMIMHACEIPQGNHWEKVIAKDAIKTLSYNDEAGCLQSQGGVSWVFKLQQVKDKNALLARVDRMTPQDMPDYEAVLVEARDALRKSDATTKHIILVTDGDPQPPTQGTLTTLKNLKITCTTIGVATHQADAMGQGTLQRIATATGGKCYIVKNNKDLPKIFQKEARTVSRPLIFEKEPGWSPKISVATDPIAGLTSAELPPIKGLVLTTAKKNELVEVPILSPFPPGTDNPVLAHWQYGLGKSVAFTSDAGQKWTTAWTGWENYRKFWSQLVRWSMRTVDSGNIVISTHVADGKIKVIADALDKDNKFINFARIEGYVVDPEMNRKPVELVQVAPGRYEGIVEGAENRGTYFISAVATLPGGQQTHVSTGVSVPYPAEYKELESNPGLLEQLSSVTGGHVVKEEDAMRFEASDNPFRRDLPPPRAAQDIWHLLVFAAMPLFLFDVAVRRIAVDLSMVRPGVLWLYNYARGRRAEAAATEYLTKLRSRKAEVAKQLDAARATRRFDPTPDAPAGSPTAAPIPSVLTELNAPATASRAARPTIQPQVSPDAPAQAPETYTSRLLRAKKKVWEDKDK